MSLGSRLKIQRDEHKESTNDWTISTLGNEIESIVGGGTPSKENAEYWSGNIPWASVKDLVGSRLSKTQDYITPEALKNSSSSLIPAMTLIVATRMGLGRVAFFDCDIAINQDLKAIFPKSSLNKEFLFYWFQHNAEKIEAMGSGSTVKGIRLEVLREFTLQLPPLSEQKRIVSILSALDAELEVLSQLITNTHSLKNGMMRFLFKEGIGCAHINGKRSTDSKLKNTDSGRNPARRKIGKIGDYILALRAGVSVNAEDRVHEDEEIGVLKVSSVIDGIFYPNAHKAVLAKEEFRVAEPVLKGHIIISRANTPSLVGESAYIDLDWPDLFLSDKLWQTEPSETPHSVQWLAFYLQSPTVRRAIRKAATGTSGSMKNISKQAFLNIPMPLIPLVEQERIAEMLSTVNSKIEVLVARRSDYLTLKRGLMQKLLTGEWRVKLDTPAEKKAA